MLLIHPERGRKVSLVLAMKKHVLCFVISALKAYRLGSIALKLIETLNYGEAKAMKAKYLFFSIAALAVEVSAESSTLDAAIGGGIGGAAGAAIGNEIGGRDGAILGGALGAAAGTAYNTDEEPRRSSPPPKVRYEYVRPLGGHPHSYHCPPGQRKKGRC